MLLPAFRRRRRVIDGPTSVGTPGQVLTLGVDGCDWADAPAPDLSGYATTTDLAGYAPVVHTHTSSDVTDFASAVDARIALTVDAAPAALDTLNELAAALGDDPNFATTTATALGTKLVKSSNLSDLTSVSTARANLGLGTSAVLDVPASGDASTAQVVKGTDTRLTNARTPTTHTHAIADVTSLQTTLDGKLTTANVLATAPMVATVGGGNVTISSSRANCKIIRAAAQTITDSVTTQILFDTAVSDPTGIAQVANNRIRVSRAGYYFIQYRIAHGTTGSTGSVNFQPLLLVNGAEVSRFSWVGAKSTFNVTISTLVYLNALDIVTAVLFAIDGAGASIITQTAAGARPELIVMEVT